MSGPRRQASLVGKCLNAEQQDLLLAAFKGRYAERNKNLALVLFNTGMRIGECLELKLGDVMAVKGGVRDVIRMRAEITKKNKERYLPLNEIAKHALEWFIGTRTDPNDYLFKSQDNNKMVSRTVQRIFKNAGIDAGIEFNVTPHKARHSFLSQVFRNTKNLRITQTLAGHSSLTTTQIYTHVTEDELADAVKTLEVKK